MIARNWMAHKLSYAQDFGNCGGDWMAWQISYTDDSETPISLSQAQCLILWTPPYRSTDQWRSTEKN